MGSWARARRRISARDRLHTAVGPLSTHYVAETLEERRLLSAVVVAPDPVIAGDLVSGPFSPLPGHSFYVSGISSQGLSLGQWASSSAITPNTVNDLVLNVSPFSTNYTACCEGAGGNASVLTNGITQVQTAAPPNSSQPAIGDGSANDLSSATDVVSEITAPYFFNYNLGTAAGPNTASPTGYDLTEIDVVTGHQDVRTAIHGIDVLVEPVGSNQFISLSGGLGFSLYAVPSTGGGTTFIGQGSAQMAIVNSNPAQPIAQNIQAVKFSVLDPTNFFREFVLSGTASAASNTAPAVPTGVTATLGSAGVAVSWNAAANAVGYTILRSTIQGGTYAAVGSVFGQTNFTDPTAQPNATYFYEVQASGHGDSALSSPSAAFTTSNFGATEYLFSGQYWPGTPSVTQNIPQINAQGGTNHTPGGIANAQGFGGAFSAFIDGKITTDLAGTYTFAISTSDEGHLYVNGMLVSNNGGVHVPQTSTVNYPISLSASTAYNFVFVEDNHFGSVGWEMQMLWQEPTPSGPGPLVLVPATNLSRAVDPPPAPTLVTATALSDSAVSLNWTPVADLTSLNYVIERAPSDSNGNPVGAFLVVGQVPSGPTGAVAPPNWGATSFVDTTVVPGATYVYRIGANPPGQTLPLTFSLNSQPVLVPGPQVTASASGGTLSVTLAPYDVANLSINGSQVLVTEGSTTIFTVSSASITSLNVTGATPSTFNFNSPFSFTGSVNTSGISEININAALNAAQIAMAATDNITLNATVTTSSSPTFTADSDSSGQGGFVIGSSGSLNSSGHDINLFGTTFSFAGTINSGAGNIDLTGSPGAGVSGLAAHAVCSGTITIFANLPGIQAYNDTWAATTTGTVVYDFPQGDFHNSPGAGIGVNTSAGNANVVIIASTFYNTVLVTTGSGALTLQVGSAIVNGPITAGSMTIPAPTVIAQDAPITISNTLTLSGTLNVNHTTLSVQSGVTMSGSAVVNLNSTALAPATFLVAATQTVAGSGQIIFNGDAATSNGFIRLGQNGQSATLTIAPQVTIRTGTGSGGLGSGTAGNLIINQGSIIALTSGTSITLIDTVQNNGTEFGAVRSPSAITWTGNAGDGNWTTAGNWSTGQVPGLASDVIINLAGNPAISITSGLQSIHSLNSSDVLAISGGELDLTAPSTASSIILSSTGTLGANTSLSVTNLTIEDFSTLTGSGTVTVTGGMTWNGGVMQGSGVTVVAPSATLTLTGQRTVGHTPSVGVYLERTLTNSGNASWSGNIFMEFVNGIFNNAGTLTTTGIDGATLAIQAVPGSGNTASTINNTGTINVQGPATLQPSSGNGGVTVTSSGTINVTGGIMDFANVSTISGPIVANPGGTVLSRNKTTFLSGGSLSGAGTINFGGGTFTFAAGQFTPTGTVNLTAGTLTINSSFSPATMGAVGAAVTLNASLNYSGPLTISSGGSLTLQSAASLTSSNLTNNGTVTVSPGAVITINGPLGGSGNVSLGGAAGNSPASLSLASFAQNKVTINATGTMVVANNASPIANSAGVLTIAQGGKLSLPANATLTLPPGSAAFSLSGGTIAGGTLLSSGSSLTVGGSATFDGVTIGANLVLSNAALTVLDGLNLINSAVVTLSSTVAPVVIAFPASESISGQGQLVFNAPIPSAADYLSIGQVGAPATLLIGPSITITTGTGSGVIGSGISGNQINNQGTILSQTAGTSISYLDSLTNQGAGSVGASGGGTIDTPVYWTGAGDGTSWTVGANWSTNSPPGSSNAAVINVNGNPTISITSGTQSVGGLFNYDPVQMSGGTLALTNARIGAGFAITAGTLLGGAYSSINGAAMSVGSAPVFDGITLDTPLIVTANNVLHIKDGLTLNSILTLSANQNGIGPAILQVDGSQTIGGTGQIVFNGDDRTTTSDIDIGQGTSSATLAIGPSITVQTGNGSGIIGNGILGNQVINQGTILSNFAAATITVLDPLVNQGAGVAQTANGGFLNVNTNGVLTISSGQVNLGSTAPVIVQSFVMTGGAISSSNAFEFATATVSGGIILGSGGLIVSPSATVNVTGTFVLASPLINNGSVVISSGGLELDGGGNQSGTFTVGAGTVLTFGGTTTQNFSAGSSISGAGIVQFGASDLINVSGSYSVGGTVVQGLAQVNLPANASMGVLSLISGTISFNTTGGSGAAPGVLGPAVSGGTVTVTSQQVLDGGTLIVQPGWTLDDTGLTVFGAAVAVQLVSDNVAPAILLLGGDVIFASPSGTASINSTGAGSKPGILDLGGGTRSFTINDGTAAIDMTISASMTDGAIRMAGAGWTQLTGANAYTGGTTVAGGTLEADSSSSLGSGPLTFNGGSLALRGLSSLSTPLTSAPGSSISLDVGSSSIQVPGATLGAAFNVTGSGGSLQITGPVTLQGAITINNSANLEITGAISGTGGITKTLAGTLTFDGSSANSYTGGTVISGGTLVLNKPAGVIALPAGGVTLNGPATLQLSAPGQMASANSLTLNSVPGLAVFNLNSQSQSISSLTCTGVGTSASNILLGGGQLSVAGTVTINGGNLVVPQTGQLALGGLNITGSGKLDIQNNPRLLLAYSGSDPLALIRGYLLSGYNNGSWNGSGIISANAANNAARTTAIGYADSADGLIAGQAPNTIELKYTLYGDTTLTASVGFNDFTRLTQHYNQTSGGAWDTGDFNYDGSVNSADFTLLTRTYNTSLGSQALPAVAASTPSSPLSAQPPAPPTPPEKKSGKLAPVIQVKPDPPTAHVASVSKQFTKHKR